LKWTVQARLIPNDDIGVSRKDSPVKPRIQCSIVDSSASQSFVNRNKRRGNGLRPFEGKHSVNQLALLAN